jgi:hypothetical protein
MEAFEEINKSNIQSAEYALESAKQVLYTVNHTFPLYYLEPLVEAAKMDVTVCEKILDSYTKDTRSISMLSRDKEKAYELLKKQAERRATINKTKLNAARHLEDLSSLQQISTSAKSLGKRKSIKARKTNKRKNKSKKKDA